MRLLTSLLAAAIALPACATDDGTADMVELAPGSAKADGAAVTDFLLTPDRPSKMFRIRCNEWFSCDLTLQLTAGSPLRDVVVTVTRASDGKVVELEGSELDEARLWSPDAREQFEIDVTKHTWEPGNPGNHFVMVAYWN